MQYESSPEHNIVLNTEGHVLVTGGPGCGKTTLALRKAALKIEKGILAEQKILFLSFSRSAVSRLFEAVKINNFLKILDSVEISTFHAFFWKLLKAYSYLLGIKQSLTILLPQDELTMRNGETAYDSVWDNECERLFYEQSKITFDLFAKKALLLLEKCKKVRDLVMNKYPLIIVDEAQDTAEDQWNAIRLLSSGSQILCLADLDQQIFDFRRGVSLKRIDQIVQTLAPKVVDLGLINNRSQNTEILEFGNDILNNTPRGAPYKGVSQFFYNPIVKDRNLKIKTAIGIIYRKIKAETGEYPKNVGILASWGRGVTTISRALNEVNEYKPIRHNLIIDETSVFLSARVVAHCLEPISDIWESLTTTIILISEVYRANKNIKKAGQLLSCAEQTTLKKLPKRSKCPIALKQILENINLKIYGNPSLDWMAIRNMFKESKVKELEYIDSHVAYLMAFNRGVRISASLSEVWSVKKNAYDNARNIIEIIIAESLITRDDSDLHGINVMTIHKSKGKEFDGIIIFDGGRISPLVGYNDNPPYIKSRKLVRVAITRAKKHVLILTDASASCPLLNNHVL